MGDEAIGTISVNRYSPEFDSPANKRFVAAMRREYGVLSGSYSAQTYIAGQCIEAAIEKLGGEADDRKARAEGLHEVSLMDTRAPVRFDQN